MSRKSISFSEANEAWIQDKIDSGEYTSKSEVVNGALRTLRKQEDARRNLLNMLERASKSGISNRTPAQIREDVLKRFEARGD